MNDHSKFRLGKRAAVAPAHIHTIGRYAALAPLPTPPPGIDWTNGIDWPLLANNMCGDCTVAGVLHAIQCAERWRDGVGRAATDAQAIYGYSTVSAYPASDNGAVIADVMAHWRDVGFNVPGGPNQILSYVRVEPVHLRTALWLLGPVIIGVQLPISAQQQSDWKAPANLDGDNAPGSWGGHCVVVARMDADGGVWLVTWGKLVHADAGWLTAYMDEAWSPVQPAWLAAGKSPSGILATAISESMGVAV